VFARRLLFVALLLVFLNDAGTPYEKWFGPFSWASFLLEAAPWKIRWIDHLFLISLALAPRGDRGALAAPMRTTLYLSGGTTAIWLLYGVANGGDAWAGSWQIYLMVSGVLLAFTASAVLRTPEHWASLIDVLFVAAAYRAFMCWAFYMLYIRTNEVQTEFITSHDDTVLWVVCILVLLLRLLEPLRPGQRWRSVLLMVLLFGAVLFNARRIAWVSLAMGSALMLYLLPAGKAKRRAIRGLLVIAPILLIYVVVGWGRTEQMFKPLRSFATVSTQEDTSTKARNVENLGLIATSNANNPLMGTGWGHPYIEVSNKYSIARFFPLWQYIPHNSILGLLAYTGILGFIGYWLVYPTTMFLTARMARMATTPLLRQLAIYGGVQLVVCANQFYGDMGIYYAKSVYMLCLSYGLALRLAVSTGAWPAQQRAEKRPS
jgi:hypothetical protein